MSRFKPPQKARRDDNEPLIVAALRAHGFVVHLLDQPVDLLITKGGHIWLGEVKNPGARGRLTETQKRFFDAWPVEVKIFENENDVNEFAANVRPNSVRLAGYVS